MTIDLNTDKDNSDKLLIDNACEKYKEIVDTHQDDKFCHLPSTLVFESSHLLEEAMKTSPRNGKFYKRGTLIFADFGVGIGSEFSGPHFAIILNKRDNPDNESLTVIPLISEKPKHELHDSKFHLKIGSEVFDRITEQLTRQSNENEEKILKLTRAISVVEESIGKVNFQEMQSKLNEIDSNLYSKARSTSDLIRIFKKEISACEDRLNKQQVLIEKYSGYDKNTIVLPYQLTTISKKRIRKRHNEFDPIGQIQVSSDVMDLIYRKLIESFIGIESIGS